MTEVSVVFVDVRGFTGLSEQLPPKALTDLMNGFYRTATAEVIGLDGTVDKFVGDQIMAFFGAPFRSEDHAERAVQAAVAIVMKAGRGMGVLPLGGGVASGLASVGNVGGGDIKDYTVLGDVVNTASRLQAAAGAGEVLVAAETYESVRDRFPQAEERILELRGKSASTAARVLRVTGGD